VASNATGSPTVITLAGSSYYVSLSWTASSSNNVVSYNVYRGTTQGSYTKINASPVTTLSYPDMSITATNITYYYVVTAVDSSGVESTDSTPASVTIP
jgi:fibronectin type 3 domain-containing protein